MLFNTFSFANICHRISCSLLAHFQRFTVCMCIRRLSAQATQYTAAKAMPFSRLTLFISISTRCAMLSRINLSIRQQTTICVFLCLSSLVHVRCARCAYHGNSSIASVVQSIELRGRYQEWENVYMSLKESVCVKNKKRCTKAHAQSAQWKINEHCEL